MKPTPVKPTIHTWIILLYSLSSVAFAQGDAPKLDTGDTAWVLVSSALLLFMTPGLAFFYGGLVRAKNVLNTMMMSFAALGVVGVLWALIGYSLAFAPGNPFIGGLSWLGLNNVGLEPYPAYWSTVPHQAFMVYQMMFAIITPAVISGAIVERMRFKAFLAFLVLWSLFVYPPLAHWIWASDGWLRKLGAIDFAGGTAVEIASGFSALAAVLVLGSRRGFPKTAFAPHNVPLALIGAGILWFGWIGFNAGGALGANGVATTAVAGLVAITPAAGFVTPLAAILIGAAATLVSYTAIQWRNRVGLDDSLDVFACHGLSGVTGTILLGVFATTAVNAGGANGLVNGNPGQLGIQLIAVLAAAAFAFVGTTVVLRVIALFTALRPSGQQEDIGLDLADHGETGYHGGEYGLGDAGVSLGSTVTLPATRSANAAD